MIRDMYPGQSYLNQAALPPCSPPRRNSRSISNTDFRRGVSRLPSAASGQWHHIQSNTVRVPSAKLANLPIDPHQGYTDCMQCMLWLSQRVSEHSSKKKELIRAIALPMVSGWASMSCFERPNEAQYSKCKAISCWMCSTISADWNIVSWLHGR